MAGLTFDTGALIALERGDRRMSQVMARAIERDVTITVPVAVVAEWWRGASPRAEWILQSTDVEPMDESLARTAGEAIGEVRGATTVDAIVMASAARRGDLVYTSDFDDLCRLAHYFRAVRVLSVNQPARRFEPTPTQEARRPRVGRPARTRRCSPTRSWHRPALIGVSRRLSTVGPDGDGPVAQAPPRPQLLDNFLGPIPERFLP